MSNVKQVRIRGQMTFDASPGEMKDGVWHDLMHLLGTPAGAANRVRQDEALRLLGQIALPTIGLQIKWTGQQMVPNNHGGQMAMMAYEISGEEAWSWDALDSVVKTLGFVGTVEAAQARDVENEGKWSSIGPEVI